MADIKERLSFDERGPIHLTTEGGAYFYVRSDGPTPLIEVGGEIDLANADQLAGCLSVFDPGDAVIVDVSNLSFMDSHGIALLAQTASRDVKVICRGAQGSVRRVLDICGMDTVLTIED